MIFWCLWQLTFSSSHTGFQSPSLGIPTLTQDAAAWPIGALAMWALGRGGPADKSWLRDGRRRRHPRPASSPPRAAPDSMPGGGSPGPSAMMGGRVCMTYWLHLSWEREGERERESPSKCMDSREEQYMMTLMALGSSPSRRQSSKALSYLPALVPHEHLHPLYQLGSAKQHGPGQPLLGIGRVHRTFAIVVVRWEGRRADEHRGGQACEHHLTGRASSCMQGRYMQRLVRGDI